MSGPVELSRSTLDQLDDLPGIASVLAQRILDCRTAQGLPVRQAASRLE
jgi:DNA uptake protein ComE-like DNA-binding protein